MHSAVGIVIIVVLVAVVLATGAWRVRSLRPNRTKIIARRRAQGNAPMDPN